LSAAAIDTHLLLKVFYTSLVAGVGACFVFSIAVYGVIRSSDMRREQRLPAAASYALLGAVGLILAAAIVVYGLILLTRKS
jgi:hypothetical protein